MKYVDYIKPESKLKIIFVFIFIVYNYKLFSLFFIDEEVESKINIIDNYIDLMGMDSFLMPLLITFILMVLPSVISLLKELVLYKLTVRKINRK
ncbi:MAG: hypothetical protein ACPGSD_17700 [Flavobacteriales bacterium]|jgi:TRAP-type C4-dicarboxylate transport system permease small subunit